MVPQELYDNLERFKDFDVGDNTEKFLETVDAIVAFQEPSSISLLLRQFRNDDREYSWVYESMRSSIEHYPDEIYVGELSKNLPMLLDLAPEWASSFFYGIFNHPLCLKYFKEKMFLASKSDLLKLFDIMEKESPHHQDLIKELRVKLSQ